ncbi:unnamed protein product [Caenorhabditis angaria]|uniref:DZF domain-containing protein n=1 Tax=Caenorhabditis angaria TaxID=860376 RepID=A0A9P1J0T8_9PELO|nr:unnamed protein product [Caenorhabditis angaria]
MSGKRGRRHRGGINKRKPPMPIYPAFAQAPIKPPFFDMVMLQDSFDGTKNNLDAAFEKEIIDKAKLLQPTAVVKAKVGELTEHIINALNLEKEEKTLADVVINHVAKVGSFNTDTTLNTSAKSDIALQLCTLPSFETLSAISKRVIENIQQKSNFKDVITAVNHDYGCCIMTPNAQARILVTILPEISEKLEPDLHLGEKKLMLNYFSIRHSEWFQEVIESIDSFTLLELRSLIRVLRHAKNRFMDLQSLSIWNIHFLAFYSLLNGPRGTKVNLGTAFRRFFELLAAGILLPKTRCMIDPTSKSMQIGWELTNAQRDALTMAGQTMVRIFATGNDGYRAVLGTLATCQGVDLTQQKSAWNGIVVEPLRDAFKEGCMDPYLIEPGFVEI